MPFIAFGVIAMLGMLGISTDLMDDFQTVHQLDFAARAAAIYGLSRGLSYQHQPNDGSYSLASAQTNIINAITNGPSAGNAWNIAPAGVKGSNAAVTFQASNVAITTFNNDPGDLAVQLTAQRTGTNALSQFFLPLLYTSLSAVGVPVGAKTFSTNRAVVVVGQPATRIGAGAALSLSTDQTLGDLVGFASLPLAISNNEFKTYANPSQIGVNPYTINIASQPTAGTNTITACLTNVSMPSGNSTYGTATNSAGDVGQLQGLLNYFLGLQANQLPAVVECGSVLNAYNFSSLSQTQQSTIVGLLQQLAAQTTNYYIVPVISADPIFPATGPIQVQVVGFAYLQLTNVTNTNGTLTITAKIPDGRLTVVPNATCTTISSMAQNAGSTMFTANPPIPFTPRTFNPTSTTMSSLRYRGVVFAPTFVQAPTTFPANG